MIQFLETILKVDVLINSLANQMGSGLYVLIFFIVFAETGLVFLPFLPGDSLLFAVGALSASSPFFEIKVYIPLLILASVLGDSTNYFIGRRFGRKLFEKQHFFSSFFNKKYLKKTEDFYVEKGSIAVFIARFIPILRTMAPFVGGLTAMPYKKFLCLSFLGSVVWVNVFCLAGYFFGQIPIIHENFTFLVMGIVGLSMVPLFIGLIKRFFLKKNTN